MMRGGGLPVVGRARRGGGRCGLSDGRGGRGGVFLGGAATGPG